LTIDHQGTNLSRSIQQPRHNSLCCGAAEVEWFVFERLVTPAAPQRRREKYRQAVSVRLSGTLLLSSGRQTHMKEMSSQSSTTQTIDGWIPDTRSIVSVFGARLPVMDMIVIPRLSYHRALEDDRHYHSPANSEQREARRRAVVDLSFSWLPDRRSFFERNVSRR
jgi:hypothetical protein